MNMDKLNLRESLSFNFLYILYHRFSQIGTEQRKKFNLIKDTWTIGEKWSLRRHSAQMGESVVGEQVEGLVEWGDVGGDGELGSIEFVGKNIQFVE